MKQVLIIFFLIIALVSAFIVVMKSTKSDVKNFEILKKEIAPSLSNKAIIKGIVQNNGKDAKMVLIKAVLKDEKGTILDEPYISLRNVAQGEKTPFSIESYADFYKVTSFEVFVESSF